METLGKQRGMHKKKKKNIYIYHDVYLCPFGNATFKTVPFSLQGVGGTVQLLLAIWVKCNCLLMIIRNHNHTHTHCTVEKQISQSTQKSTKVLYYSLWTAHVLIWSVSIKTVSHASGDFYVIHNNSLSLDLHCSVPLHNVCRHECKEKYCVCC